MWPRFHRIAPEDHFGGIPPGRGPHGIAVRSHGPATSACTGGSITTTDPIAVWHHAVATHDLAPFEALLADDVVFQSPAVHAPQTGKPIVTKYLRAAMTVLNNETFRYLDEWRGEQSAILEFEATIEGIYINGIDLIRWNDDGRVVNFKVMVRPLKALNLVVSLMGTQLQPARA